MSKVIHRYSDAFKRSVVAEVESGRYTAVEAAAVHQITFVSVYRWMKRLGGPQSQTRIVRIEMPDERNRIKELEKEKHALESALAQAHMKILLLESTVEVLEEKTGVRIKKKDRHAIIERARGKGLSLSWSCSMLNISRQAVHRHRHRVREERVREQDILPKVRAIREIMPRYGTRKLMAEIPELGIGRDKVFAILRKHGLLVKRRRRYVLTTDSRHNMPVYPNLLPEVTVTAPNNVWVADQTYIRLRDGFCYLSLVTDLYSRKIVGYDVYPTLEAQGPLNAFTMALAHAPNTNMLIHHSDRGSQYCSLAQKLKPHGIRISMSQPRRPDQNAVAERVNGILKGEFYLDTTFNSFSEARKAIIESISIYNNQRRHLSLGMITPSMKHAA